MSKFETGRTYYTRSICDHNCVIEMPVLSRTATMITTLVHGNVKRLRVKLWDGVETVKPWGSFSMSPIVKADDTKELKPDWAT